MLLTTNIMIKMIANELSLTSEKIANIPL